MKTQIILEDTLVKALKEGINLFVGAGFSLLAKNKEGINLPIGETLLNEIRLEFDDVPKNLDLPKSAMYLEKTNKQNFIRFLKNRFCVSEFDENYLNVLLIGLKGVYSTNIDNLFQKIFENSLSLYLNDVTIKGAIFNESKAVKYVPLHGSIYNDERKLIFSSADISSAFSNDRDIWQYLRMAIEEHPTIFWGYSLNDSGVIQTLFSNPARESFQKTKWIVLHEKKDADIKFFEALGFNIIISDTISFLQYLGQKAKEFTTIGNKVDDFQYINLNDFKDLSIPKIGTGPIRPLSEFYLGAPPIWNDIFTNKIYKTSHYEKIIDLINKSKKNIIILGTPISGKTTLMMQIAANYKFSGYKLVGNFINAKRAEIISKLFSKQKLLFFIDDLRDNLDSVEILLNNKNIRIISFEREHNYEVVSHIINDTDFEFYDITTLEQRDIQAIYNSIPTDIKKRSLTSESNDSIFEFICLNIEKQNVKERFNRVYEELKKQSIDLVDLFVMCCYCHYCRIPVSIDMAYAFLSDNHTDYHDIIETIDQLGKLVTDYDYHDPLIDKDQDYFQARSHVVSETVMKYVPSLILKRVLSRFHNNVPVFRIANYNVFKKTAYDKDFILRAFPDWEEGKDFYQFLYDKDKDYYILQQGSLYLASKKKYADAFDWIDLAIQESEGRIFSIKNTHAIILFDANILGHANDSLVKQNLDRSMNILSDCYKIDRRKYYHARIFAVQAISYYHKYKDSIAKEYLLTAKERLDHELKGQPYYKHKRLRELLKDVNDLITTT